MVLGVIIVLVFLVALVGSIGIACGYPQLDVKQSRGRVYSPLGEPDLDAIQWPIGGSAVIGPLVEPAENAFPLHYRSPLLDRPPNPDLDIVYSHLGKSVEKETAPGALILNPGGQSNKALIALMKKIDKDIVQRQGSEPDTLQACQENMEFAPADWRKL